MLLSYKSTKVFSLKSFPLIDIKCIKAIFIICLYRLNYTANYGDAEGVTITAIDFDRIIGLQIYSFGFLSYFLNRGYTADKDIRIACYDWRLAPGMHLK